MNLRPALIACLASFALIGCGSKAEETRPAPAEEAIVNVHNWVDHIDPETLAAFTAESGIKVNYDVYFDNAALDALLAAGDSGADVVFPGAYPFAKRQLAAGHYARLDKQHLRNWSHLDPEILHALEGIDPGNRHLVPYLWGTMGLGLWPDKVQAVLGDAAPLDSWALLFKPENAARLARCGIGVPDEQETLLAAALIFQGQNPENPSPEALQQAGQQLDAVMPYLRRFDSSGYRAALARGEICLAFGHSNQIALARVYAEQIATPAAKGSSIRYVVPQEGSLRWVDVIAIPKTARHPGNALHFINYLLQPEVICRISEQTGLAHANRSAGVNAQMAADPAIYPPKAMQGRLYLAPRLPAP